MRNMFLSVVIFFIATSVYAQTIYKGRVIDNHQVPIIGANILSVENPNKGTTTDLDGNFSIELNNPNVRISFVGFKTKEVKLTNKFNSIVLEESAVNLDEIVITAYGDSDKRSLVGVANKVSDKELSRTAAVSFESSLQGSVSGVNVYKTGQPGGSSNVQIRGVGSINGLTQPLYVLDGIVINSDNNSRIGGIGAVKGLNPLATLNSNDIESVTVLKDAAAASLYGSRAANGVVVITTKKGKKGETEMTFSAEFGPTFNLTKEETISNTQFRNLWEEGQLHQYIQKNENSEFTRVYNNSTLYAKYSQSAKSDYEKIYGAREVNSDWLGEIYRIGSIQKYGLSARGGNEKTKFYASGNYSLTEGTIIKTDYKRYSGMLNLENKAKDWLTLGVNFSATKSERNTGQWDGTYAGGLNPLYMARVLPQAAPIYDPKGYMGIANLPNGIEKNSNPIGMIKVGKYANNEIRVRGNAFAEVKLLEDIKFKTTLGIDHQSNEESLYDNKEFGAGGGRWNGVLYVSQGGVFQQTSSNLLTYNKTIDEHNVGALVGFESQVSKMKSIRNAGYDVLDNELLSSSSIGSLWSWKGHSENYALLSYFSQFNYNFARKYYLSGSFRRDGSSRFGRDSRWGNFWSVSGAWTLSEEDFLRDNETLSYLKLRASYGTNGNLPPKYYASLAFFDSAGKSYGGSSGLSYGQLANPNLSWELSNNLNLGIDAVILEKLHFSVEYFVKETKDLLLDIPVSGTTGFKNQLQNYGEMKNSGWELELSYTPVQNDDFSWNTKLNLSMLSNEVTKLKGDLIPSYSSRYGQKPTIVKVGSSLNSFYLREYAGVNKENGLAQYYVLKDGKRTGEITTKANEAGFGIFGKAFQDVQGGMSNQFSYKNFDLDLFFTFGIGGEVYDRTAFKRDDDGYAPQFTNTTAQLNPWNPNNTNSNVPIRINGNNTFSNDVSTRHLYSADYFKLKNVKLSFNLPEVNAIKGGSIYVQGDNLLLFTEMNDYDPEAISDGINFFQAPTATSVVLGIQLKF